MDELVKRLRNSLAREIGTSVLEVEKGALRRYCEATEDMDPIYLDPKAARRSRFRGLVAPPGFLITLGRTRRPNAGHGVGRGTVNAGNDYEFYKPVRPGDVITTTTRIADITPKIGRSGPMIMVTTENTYTNQRGEVVGIGRWTTFTLGVGEEAKP